MSTQEFLQAARRHAANLVENAKQQFGITLDYSVLSLMVAASVAKKYHEIYKRARAANDPEIQKFVQAASFEITSYVGEVFVRHCGATWAIGEKREVLLQVGKQRLPIHEEILREIVEGGENILLMIPKVQSAVEQAPAMLRSTQSEQAQSTKPQPPPAPASPPVDAALQENMRKSAERAVEVAREQLTLTLDYGWQSLATMDEAVDSFHRYKTAKPDDSNFVVPMTMTFGAYIGEVIRRTHNGYWVQDSPSRYAWLWIAGARMDVLSHVHRRITEGTPPTLRSYVDDTLAQARQARSGKPSYDAQALKQEMVQAAAVAIKDMKAMLKRELDFTAASLPGLQDALMRVRAMIESSPEHKSAIVTASLKKYGAYLGEIMDYECGGVWCKNVEGIADDLPALCLGISYAVPQHMIAAVLEGKALHMGGLAQPVTTVPEYFEACRTIQNEWLSKMLDAGKTKESVREAISDDAQTATQIYYLCRAALITANAKWDLRLDLSPASIEGLEDLLSKLWDMTRSAAPDQKPTQEQIGTAVFMWGAYLGEVIRRTVGGKWIPSAGPPKRSVLQITATDFVDPLVKVNGRLFNGTEDNVHYYFQKMVERFGAQSAAPSSLESAPAATSPADSVMATAVAQQSPASAAVPSPAPAAPEETEIGGEEVAQLQKQVRAGDLIGLREFLLNTRGTADWQDRFFVITRVIPNCHLNVLDSICEREPQSADVHLLRCALFAHLASEARGTRRADQTSDQQTRDAAHCVIDALKDYDRALQLDPGDPTGHALVMRPLTIFSDLRPRLQAAYRAASRIAPQFLQLHFAMVNAESERWGGSHDKSLAIARNAMLGAPAGSDMAACLFWAHTLAWTHLLAFDRDKAKAASYRQSPGIKKELTDAFDRWTGEGYQPRRSSIIYFHYAAFWFYAAGDRERLRKALAYTQGLCYEWPWSMIGPPHEVYAKAVKAAE